MPEVFPSFITFMEQAVIPTHEENPDATWIEPDETEDRRGTFGSFRYAGKVWKVHKDTRFGVAIIAYHEIKRPGGTDPFIQDSARGGFSLNLRPDLREQYGERHKHFYVYDH